MIKCKRCGRPLTAKTSIERGYGLICWEKHKAEVKEDEIVDKIVEIVKREVKKYMAMDKPPIHLKPPTTLNKPSNVSKPKSINHEKASMSIAVKVMKEAFNKGFLKPSQIAQFQNKPEVVGCTI